MGEGYAAGRGCTGGIAKATEKLLVVVGLIMGRTRGRMLLKQKKTKHLCAGDGMG